jgi:hypothetical protein
VQTLIGHLSSEFLSVAGLVTGAISAVVLSVATFRLSKQVELWLGFLQLSVEGLGRAVNGTPSPLFVGRDDAYDRKAKQMRGWITFGWVLFSASLLLQLLAVLLAGK